LEKETNTALLAALIRNADVDPVVRNEAASLVCRSHCHLDYAHQFAVLSS
jgi:hypothetical protein